MFTLTNDSLRRLVNVIIAFYSSIGATAEEYKDLLIYQIVCVDNSIITTDDLQDILDIENRGSTKIVKISIYSNSFSNKNHTGINYAISFEAYKSPDKYGMVSADTYFSNIITIDGNNSENCERLMNSIKSYIENSIYSKKSVTFTKIFWFFQRPIISSFSPMILGAICMTSVLIISKQNLDAQKVYLNVISLAIAAVIFVVFSIRFDIIANRLPYIFDFGTNPENYSEKIRPVKVILGVFSTIIIGIITSLLYELLLK